MTTKFLCQSNIQFTFFPHAKYTYALPAEGKGNSNILTSHSIKLETRICRWYTNNLSINSDVVELSTYLYTHTHTNIYNVQNDTTRLSMVIEILLFKTRKENMTFTSSQQFINSTEQIVQGLCFRKQEMVWCILGQNFSVQLFPAPLLRGFSLPVIIHLLPRAKQIWECASSSEQNSKHTSKSLGRDEAERSLILQVTLFPDFCPCLLLLCIYIFLKNLQKDSSTDSGQFHTPILRTTAFFLR